MTLKNLLLPRIVLMLLLPLASLTVSGQEKPKAEIQARPVMWEAVNIAGRDLYLGPGGSKLFPVVKGSRYMGRHIGGNNLKFEIEDGARRHWVVKVADESQPEVAANRLLWAIGYKTEIDYIVPRLEIPNVGSFSNARFELRPDDVSRGERWSWLNNPFNDTPELRGLKIMMALINNWDLKDENTVILRNGQVCYVISDLGASFGKLADNGSSRAGRSVNKPRDYANANFISGVTDGLIDFDYHGANENLVKNVRIDDARWLVDLLNQLSDKQIEDAFRAANYKPEEVRTYAQAVKARIAALDRATKLKDTENRK